MRAIVILGVSLAGLAGAAAAAPPARPGDPLDAKPLTRIVEYDLAGQRQAVKVDGRTIQVLKHPTDSTLLVQRSPGGAFLQGAAEGSSVGLAPAGLGEDVYRRAAETVTAPSGCAVTQMRAIDGRVSWEATYACPRGGRLKEQK